MSDDFLPGGRYSMNQLGHGARPFALTTQSDLWTAQGGFNDGTWAWRLGAIEEQRRVTQSATSWDSWLGGSGADALQRAGGGSWGLTLWSLDGDGNATRTRTPCGSASTGTDSGYDADRAIARVMTGLAPVREVLAPSNGAAATTFDFHGGVVDIVFGLQRIVVSVRAGAPIAVVDGRAVGLGGTAELDGGTLYVPRSLRDEAMAADERAARRKPASLPSRQLERLFERHGLARLPTPAPDSPTQLGYRAPEGLFTDTVDAFASWSPDNALSVAIADWWHNTDTQLGMARAEGLFWLGMVGYFDSQEPSWEFLAGAGDSLTAGGTEALRALETWALGAPALDKDSDAYRWGVYAEMGAEVAFSGASVVLKHRAEKLIAQFGSSALVRERVHAATARRLRREIAKALAEEAGHKVSFEFHHLHPLFGHIGGQKALFPTAGLPASIANSTWNMTPLIGGRAVHAAEHRSMAQMERLLAVSVNRWKAAARTGWDTVEDLSTGRSLYDTF
ncbi:MAG: hypothetical protein HZB16_17780 [Armatimonadetes bacterium]|nr:hypothetical protein [Armatimonadota bacterium]